ncbi:sirohydrochlorin chelatase [Gracilibacillus sp. YIM 98692]|uniref:sirohydrochlorin chelatase n=1 Tax=Gracilibacillus sp. YIM 98692 TaxID=2663532 RepID=UPI0013D51432|nr:sirohydrochlorin chelatase [Gracilibacillus sp. YIM 98692]
MIGVLYICHGTRWQNGQEQSIRFVEKAKKRISVQQQEVCFLELCQPTVPEAVQKLVENGVTKIVVIPVLLLKAGHALRDIPSLIEQCQKEYPFLDVEYGEPVGVQERLTETLVDRIHEQNVNAERILLVGRGSKVERKKQDLYTVAYHLKNRLNVDVEIAYLAACVPRFEDVLQKYEQQQIKSTIVIPYLWFDGLLWQSIREEITRLQDSGKPMHLTEPLYDHPVLLEAFVSRVKETLNKGAEETSNI